MHIEATLACAVHAQLEDYLLLVEEIARNAYFRLMELVVREEYGFTRKTD